MLSCQLLQALLHRFIASLAIRQCSTLCAAVLLNNPTCTSFAQPSLLPYPVHGTAALTERQNFLLSTSFSTELSIARSAYIFFSRAFSASSSRSRCMSDTDMPPNLARHW